MRSCWRIAYIDIENDGFIRTISDSILCENVPTNIEGKWIDGGGNCLASLCTDLDGNGIPDECDADPCPADLDGDGSVGVKDLLILLGVWGPCKGCPADFDGSGDVGVKDLLILLGAWGPCP